jgi:uncharacterized RDD family membrane protein YckC
MRSRRNGLLANMDRRAKRTVISILDANQQELDFDEAAHALPFTFPEYQRELIASRIAAGFTDFAIVAGVYAIFIAATFTEWPQGFSVDRRVLGIYAVCYFLFAVIYFLLFMLSASQTPGMRYKGLIAVSRDGELLDPKQACMRGFGYLISILPLLLGFIWMFVDPEHLTWADKVSSTYVKKL